MLIDYLNSNKHLRIQDLGKYINNDFILLEEVKKYTNYLDLRYPKVVISQRLYHIINNLNESVCLCNCGKSLNYNKFSKGYYTSCGKNECKQKIIKQTSFKKFGFENAMKNPDLKKKHEYSCIENCGSKTFLGSKKCVKSRTNLIFNTHYSNIPNLISVDLTKGIIKFICPDCNTENIIKKHNYFQRKKLGVSYCLKCRPKYAFMSIAQTDIYHYIKSIYDGEIMINYRSLIKNMEIDIYLPDLKLGIEYNGIYWHSLKKKSIDYHLNKFKKCKEKGVQLLQIWEDQYKDNKNDILNLIHSNIIKNNNSIIKDFKEIKQSEFLYRFNSLKIFEKCDRYFSSNNFLASIIEKDKEVTIKNYNGSLKDIDNFLMFLNTDKNIFIELYNDLEFLDITEDFIKDTIYFYNNKEKRTINRPSGNSFDFCTAGISVYRLK